MSAPATLRKGWCPGALRPMAAKDGLLVRLRISGGIVPSAVARALADSAERHGSGVFDLSARGNLQMRGVGEATLPALLDDLRALALVDETAGGEAVRNVVASPLAGCRGGFDIRPLTAALERRLVTDAALHALPGKFGFLIDDGGTPSLASVPADVRFDWCHDDRCFVIGLGGARHTAIAIATCRPEDLADRAARVARGVLPLFARGPARRMVQLVETFGAEAVARACGGAHLARDADDHDRDPDIVGHHTFDGVPTLGLAAPFGRLDAAMLRHAAAIAEDASGDLRLTPWRTILVPGAAGCDLAAARERGFIVEDRDPRRAVTACVGRDGCARGTTPTRADAASLAANLPNGFGGTLHVSGCEKGCAKPSASAATLIGREGRYDLVWDGHAGDPPTARGLDLAGVRAALAAGAGPVGRGRA